MIDADSILYRSRDWENLVVQVRDFDPGARRYYQLTNNAENPIWTLV